MSRLLRIPEAASLGLHATVILAGSPDEPRSVRELAQTLHASEAHLSKVMQRLAKAGLVSSTRGPGGGFVLAKPPDHITLLEVYEAIEGPVEPSACVFGTQTCGRDTCIFGVFLQDFDTHFREYLARARLSDLVTELVA